MASSRRCSKPSADRSYPPYLICKQVQQMNIPKWFSSGLTKGLDVFLLDTSNLSTYTSGADTLQAPKPWSFITLLSAPKTHRAKGKNLRPPSWTPRSVDSVPNRSTESLQMSSLKTRQKAFPPSQIRNTKRNHQLLNPILRFLSYLVPSSSRSKRRKRAANARYNSQNARLLFN